MATLTLPLKTHGGKYYLARKIVALMPEHLHYVEPFFGGGAVLFAHDPKNHSEVANDIDGELMNFWSVLQGEKSFKIFQRLAQATPLSRHQWDSIKECDGLKVGDAETQAWRFFILCRQSLAGRRKGFTSITRNRLRRGMNGNVSEWLSAVDGLSVVHERLRRVVVECMDGTKLIQREDTAGTLFYCDPPYLHSTRATVDVYEHEMSDTGHLAFLDTIKQCQGRLMVSGYRSPMYDEHLKSWNCREFRLSNNAAGGKSKRRMTECLWMNF
jgi:DNA adenine methylase